MSEPRRPVAVVTGASGGVGRAIACALAEDGFDIALLARGADGLEGARRDVEARGARALVVPTDVAVWRDVDAAAERTEHALGPIDVWVNNAMATVFSPVKDLDPADVARSIEVTLLGQVHGTLAALARMRTRNRGAIVSIGSALAYRGIPLQAPYCAAKFGVRGFNEAVRTELLHDGSNITISEVHLPAIDTPQFSWCRSTLPLHPRPVAPVYRARVAADAVRKVLRRRSRSRIVGGWNRIVVYGTTVMPGVFDHLAARTAWEGQQDETLPPGPRPGNLDEPVDEAGAGDRGTSGVFGDEDRGMREIGWLTSLPSVVGTLAASAADRATAVMRAQRAGRGRLAEIVGDRQRSPDVGRRAQRRSSSRSSTATTASGSSTR